MRLSCLTLVPRDLLWGLRCQAIAKASWTTGFNYNCFTGSLPEPSKG